MKQIEIFTDGACSGNPGPGGIGVILRYLQHEKTISQGYKHTTNNRMELRAAICALQSLKEPCLVDFYIDSQYVKNGIERWIFNWKRKKWAGVKNPDLWQQLDQETARHQIQWHWVRGHSGHAENERCDELARQGVKNPTLDDVGYQPEK